MQPKSEFNFLPYGFHFLDDDDIQAVVNSLHSGSLTQGSGVSDFEKQFSKSVGSEYAVAVSSATAGLHIACLASNLGPGDIAITSTNTFVATPNSVLYSGAHPIFADINSNSLNMDLCHLRKLLELKKIKVVLPVHFSGVATDIIQLKQLADEFGFCIIEDAAHALGARYETGEMVGSCKYSDMAVFSLHPVKGVTAGEGGIVTTNCEKTYRKLLQLRSHGICKGNFMFPGISDKNSDILLNPAEAFDQSGELNPWYYEMQNLGFNYRITDFQCALAMSQLKKLDIFLKRRREIAQSYDKIFKNSKFIKPCQQEFRDRSSFHLYVVEIKFTELGIDRANFMNKLRDKNIGTQVHYIPPTMQPFYAKNLKCDIKRTPSAYNYYKCCLSIPMFFGLTDEQVEFVAHTMERLLFDLMP